ncbi:hypothetical protein KQI42_02385 [Tissierella sp. MSJ-40]|uniref:Uncharacterized protein n=1 Tax=Tissierella simiarum TaxID=2841534 RepID=A0ABS6E1R3_9FIRM|nr:hypothetical protein [Tissierella simiarum]MBU5436837.1 hypothetical protein [Tissierella simiarum]
MKSDREFIDGIYNKAKKIDIIQKHKNNMIINYYFKPAMVVALILIVSPLIIFSSFNKSTEIPKGYTNKTPIARGFSISSDLDSMIQQSDLIVRGKITDIFKSEYEDNDLLFTKIEIKQIETFKGQDNKDHIILKIRGGFDKKSKTYVEYEANFKEKEDTLLFLKKIDNSTYELTFSTFSKYTYLSKSNGDRVYISPDGEELFISKLKQKIK